MKRLLSSTIYGATLFTILSASGVCGAQTDDPLLKAMQAELEREKTQLVLPGMQHPYFIEYRLDDFSTYEAVANYGALTREEESQRRIVRVTVRIGNYASDSSTGRGDGTVQLGPQDNNPEALRCALWLATDDAYKNALRAFSGKQATLERFQQKRDENDFSQEKPVVHIEPLRKLEIDRAEWKRRIVEASGLYASAPEDFLVAAPLDHVRVVSVTTGIGMSTGLGLAPEVLDDLLT